MARMGAFDSPFLLGFDRFDRMLERIAKTAGDGYPPYNIERTGEQDLRITLAVAGFRMDELEVAVEDSQLSVRGRQSDDDGERVFLHRGIAARRFLRSFVLAEGIEVAGAWLDNGLLHIDLERPPAHGRQRIIDIRSGGARPEGIVVDGGPEAA